MSKVIIDGVEYFPVVKPEPVVEKDPFKALPLGTIIRQTGTPWVYVKTGDTEALIIQFPSFDEKASRGIYYVGKKITWGGAFFEVMKLEVAK